MTQARRLALLLDLLNDRGTLSNAEIGAELGVSEATTRRYLAMLEDSQMLTRTHGGAVARGSGLEWSPQARSGRRLEAKQRIARAAVALPGDNDTLALNGGTTTAEVARQLAARHSTSPTPKTLVTTAVIGVDGIDPRLGVTNALEMEAATLRSMIRRAGRTIVVADATKFGRSAFVRVCDTADIDILVTDAPVAPELASEFAAHGPQIVVAE